VIQSRRLDMQSRKSFVTVSVVGALAFASVSLTTRPAAAQAKAESMLLTRLVSGTLSNIIGNAAASELTNLGVFSMLGLGSGNDAVINAKLDQIINQLNVIQTDIGDLKMDVSTLTSTVVAEADLTQLQTLLHDMDDASTAIQSCAQQVGYVAKSPGTDSADQQMHDFALQMVGREAGPCDLSTEFSTIHSRIVTDQSLGGAESAVYTLLARVARDKGLDYEQIASHFIQYAITQREALELIRQAYSALGEADNLQMVLTQPPSDFLNDLKDEEVAFLVATDTFITAGQPPYDTSPAALADAIVQRLEATRAQVTTYSLSILDDATMLTPMLHPPSGPAVPMTDTVAGSVSTYYAMADTTLTAGIAATCLANPPQDGFSYVRPYMGPGKGFKIGSSCTLTLERHLANNPMATPGWTVDRRYGPVPLGAPMLLNAATLADETPMESLALAGDVTGRGSGFSAFSVTADGTDPSLVTLAIDLPNQPGALIGAGTAHAFVAAATSATTWRREPFGPQYPDRYALASTDGQYLSVGTDGFAALGVTPVWFDFVTMPDGHVELDYDSGILYVDEQYQSTLLGESPDDVWATSPNLAVGAAAAVQWAVPSDNVPRTAPKTDLFIGLPCIDPTTGNHIGASYSLGPFTPIQVPTTECSDDGLPYVEYIFTLTNEDMIDRAFELKLAAQGTGVTTYNGAAYTSTSVFGLHCYGPTDHIDTVGSTANAGVMSTGPEATFNFTVPHQGSMTIYCQALDLQGVPASMGTAEFIVTPCSGTAGGSCTPY
jgi:hypothetical protein